MNRLSSLRRFYVFFSKVNLRLCRKKDTTMHIERSYLAYSSRQSAFVRERISETASLHAGKANISPARHGQPTPSSSPAHEKTTGEKDLRHAAGIAEARWQLLIALVERLTGRKLKIVELQYGEASPSFRGIQTSAATTAAPEIVFIIERKRTIESGEDLEFLASGRILTADGREIDATVSFVLSYRHREERQSATVLVNGRPRDPLVLDLTASDLGAAPSATLAFRFDLDADGQPEWLPALPAGQAFLALDHNENGRIDDGRELFGPISGAGFTELARHDADGNGWIDEADPVFSRLRAWLPGDGRLLSLSELGIGALALASAATPYSYRSVEHVETARLKRTGIFLYETGAVSTLREIDLFA